MMLGTPPILVFGLIAIVCMLLMFVGSMLVIEREAVREHHMNFVSILPFGFLLVILLCAFLNFGYERFHQEQVGQGFSGSIQDYEHFFWTGETR